MMTDGGQLDGGYSAGGDAAIRTEYSLKTTLVVSGLLLFIAPFWYFAYAGYIAIFVFTGYRVNELYYFCTNTVPAKLPPLYESMPESTTRFFPVGVSCTYTQADPSVTIVHIDYWGTAFALLPALVVVLRICLHVRAKLRRPI